MLYSFQQPFADLVAKGIKKQTIRPIGKRKHAKSGDVMQFWTGAYRKGERRKIGEAVCKSARTVEMTILPLAVSCSAYIDGTTARAENGCEYFIVKASPPAQFTRFQIEGCAELIIGDDPKSWREGNELLRGQAESDGFFERNGLSAAQNMAAFFLKNHGAGAFTGLLIEWE